MTLLRAENLGLQLALPKSVSSQLHPPPQSNPGSLPGVLDSGQRQRGIKVLLNDPGELIAILSEPTSLYYMPVLEFTQSCLSRSTFLWEKYLISSDL